MIRKIFTLSLAFIALMGLSVSSYAETPITDEQVTQLVDKTAADIAKDTPGTFAKINNGEAPYADKANPALYVFVFDTNVVTKAHAAKKELIGENNKGKPDVKGNMFRDNIVSGALKNGQGWETYFFQKPGEEGVKEKKAYYKLVQGSDGNKYIAISGKYAN